MAKISIPIACIAFVGAVFAARLAAPLIDSARADDCAAAPSTVAPRGQHWFYRIDRAKRQKCWYLHGTLRRERRASARLVSHPTAAAAVVSAAAPIPAGSPEPERPAGSLPQTPQITILTVKPVTSPFVSAEASGDVQKGAARTADASSPPQRESPRALVDAKIVPAQREDRTDAGPEAAANKAPQPTARTEGFEKPQERADPGPKAAAIKVSQATARSEGSEKPSRSETLFLLAVAASFVVFALAILRNSTGRHRDSRFCDDADVSWSGDRFGARPASGRTGSDERAASISSAKQHSVPGGVELPPQGYIASGQPPERADIERALRALREARKERIALSG